MGFGLKANACLERADLKICSKKILLGATGTATLCSTVAGPAKAKSKTGGKLEFRTSAQPREMSLGKSSMGVDWRLFFSSVRAV